MDRLSAVIAAALAALSACEDKPVDPAAAARANTVAAAPAKPQEAAESFCDAADPAGAGPAVKLPALTGGAEPGRATTWRWINLWATWCKPCIEEMPRLRRFRDQQAAAGRTIELVFVSGEPTDQGLRLADPDRV